MRLIGNAVPRCLPVRSPVSYKAHLDGRSPRKKQNRSSSDQRSEEFLYPEAQRRHS